MALAKDPDRLPRGAHVFVAMVFSTAIWAVMVFWTLAYLRRISGGLTPFDLRPFGYDLGEARTFLVALSQIGRDYYIDIQLTLDTAFPATYALSRGLLIWWLFAPGRLSERPLPRPVQLFLVGLPIATAVFDYRENASITAMLLAGPQVTADVVASASFWTQAKSLFGLLSESTALTLSAIAAMRWYHRRKARQ
jgi:hypothetical protein